jgi:putative oxidoreductase
MNIFNWMRKPDVGMFLIRLAVAVVFLYHGVSKLTNLEGTITFFGTLGLGPIFVYLVSIVEILGGLMMLVGFSTQIAGLLLAIVMISALALVKLPGAFGKWEIDLVMLLLSLGLAFADNGKYAIEKECCSSCPDCNCNVTKPVQV